MEGGRETEKALGERELSGRGRQRWEREREGAGRRGAKQIKSALIKSPWTRGRG